MISTVKNEQGCIIAYAEWETIDERGNIVVGGDYIYVQNFWIHPLHRKIIFKDLVHKIYIHPYGAKSSKIYWVEARDTGREKVLEEDDIGKTYLKMRTSMIFNKEDIYKKIMGGQHAIL